MKTPKAAEKSAGFDLGSFEKLAARQNDGVWFDLIHPVSGENTGMRVKLAGPDSEVQKAARLQIDNRIMKGARTAEARETMSLEALAACIVDWDMTVDGQALPLSTANAVRLLKAGTWIRAQIDAFASSRDAYFEA